VTSGAQAEQLAAQFLQQRGLVLLQHNYRCRHGEIDLIMRDGDMLVFVEVRLRSSNNFGGAAASIGAIKQHKLLRTAQQYLSTLRHVPPCRFDAVLFHSVDNAMDIEWVKNAFGG
jgi:putative endonuclease